MDRSLFHELMKMIEKGPATQAGLAAHRLATGEELLIEADTLFHPASVIKICTMIETFRQARAGTFSLDDRITIHNQFSSIADASPYSLEAEDDSEKELYACIGQAFTRRELVRKMVTVSSNLATNILMEQLRPEAANEFLRELGAKDVILRRGVEDNKAFQLGLNNSGTARGFMQIMLKLAQRQVISPEDSDEMIQILRQQQFNEMIPAELPAGARVAHKTGWIGGHYHDVGIVYPPDGEPMVLAILTKGIPSSDEEAHAFVASLAKAIYEAWA